MSRDLADEIIAIRRALPPAVGMAVRFGDDPAEGLTAAIPEDPAWGIEVQPVAEGWRISERHRFGGPLPDEHIALAVTSADEAPGLIADHFRRLQLQVRNAACGTPVPRKTRP
jgi:hypothetical protein